MKLSFFVIQQVIQIEKKNVSMYICVQFKGMLSGELSSATGCLWDQQQLCSNIGKYTLFTAGGFIV